VFLGRKKHTGGASGAKIEWHQRRKNTTRVLYIIIKSIPKPDTIKMMHNIIHISDIHIRTGDSKKSRYDEYISVFNNLYDSIAAQPSIIDKSAIIVITGDMFHDKNRIGPSGIKIALYLLQKLSTLTDVIVIRGNHDYRQDHPTEPDMISALMSYDIPNVRYLDTTGIHMHKNIAMGLVAIQETLLYGSTSGINASLPPFPEASESPATYKVALFHGTITGCTLQNGTTHTRDGYPIGWFQGYDAILLGDIHLQQVNRATKIMSSSLKLPHTNTCNSYKFSTETPWGYPGSLVQQNFGEPIKAHGYILWNLQNKTIHRYHIKNPYGMIKLKYTGDINTTHIDCLHCSLPISSLPDWFPDYLHIRVQGDDITNEVLRAITEKLQESGKTVLTITKKALNVIVNIDNTTNNLHAISSEIININSTDTLIEYVNKKMLADNANFKSKWINWLQHPESLLIPTNNIPENLLTKIKTKIANVEKSSEKYLIEFEKVKSQQNITGNLKINKLEWNWILNYKDANVFDFDRNYKKINVINARNGDGKSNFLEIICIALFGEGFPSRYNTSYSAELICDKKPPSIVASTSISFTLSGKFYLLERSLRSNNVKRRINFDKVKLYKIDGDKKEEIHQQNTAVGEWIQRNIGSIDTYLMSAMLSQNADKDFFNMSSKEQKELLDKVLSLNHITSLQTLLNDSLKYYKDFAELIDTYSDGVKSSVRVVEQKYIDELNILREDLSNVTKNVNELWNGWNMISEKKLLDISNIDEFKKDCDMKKSELLNRSTENRDMVINNISEINAKLEFISEEKQKYSQYSKLKYLIGPEIIPKNNRKMLSQHLQSLQMHPYYETHMINEQDEILIASKLKLKYSNEHDNIILLKKINDFETWKKIHDDRFSEYNNIDCNDDIKKQLSILEKTAFSLPNSISEKKIYLETLQNEYMIITRERELWSDKRPNKPIKSQEWLNKTKIEIDKMNSAENLIENKNFIANSIKNIPLLSNSLKHIKNKIKENNTYIKECSDLPYNDSCSACNKQSWRIKYNSIIKELPGLLSEELSLEVKLMELQYKEIDGNIDLYNYNSYCELLEECLEEINGYISLRQLWATEYINLNKWDKWTNEYNKFKASCDKLIAEIDDVKKNINIMENELHSSLVEIKELSNKLDIINRNKKEFDEYKHNLNIKQINADECKHNLDYNWYSTVHLYRAHVDEYNLWLDNELDDEIKKKRDLVDLAEKLKYNDNLSHNVNELNIIIDAFPIWNKWKDEIERDKSLTMKIKELEGFVNGAMGGNNNTHENGTLQVLYEQIKEDIILLTYLCEAFKGYKEWLYKEHIGKLIQKKVNDVLELICDERPLYLEYEWLDTIDTLSWFIRDGASRPVIEKASGFQRFIVGIAMRVAINQIGLNRVRFSELFIDEGFTACDADNLDRVPDFLRGMLRFYDNIYLATHLEDLKVCADQQVYIKRDNGLSQIQYCDEDGLRMIEVAGAGKKKRTGRPPKVKADAVAGN
jgi:DNA repair exonuclease SbcCD ATPase subunit